MDEAPSSSPDPLRIAVLASGEGTNLAALAEAIERGDLAARIVAVISNNSGSGALELARQRGLPDYHVSAKTDEDPAVTMLDILGEHRTELLVLAGYMKKLDSRVVDAFDKRAINIHPAPLPRFGGQGMYGLKVHAAVMRTGAHSTGVTVHRVTEEYDEGEMLSFRPIPIRPEDTVESLAQRVRDVEHDVYWRVIADLAKELRG